ncbi:uncharacterized protein LOC128207299 [Mya arenaria]|uniref:uncharacterized protein LOC128207299 n=1 Tax=Mya arenaria TaxID=6604 RepID=UPI0022E4544F|nr:uncharacterized protein LOC128207299 [Mya arenaria]
MVRVISQGFSTPRSRHSSGEEMIERFAEMKATGTSFDDKQTLKDDLSPKPLVIDCNTDTNDSYSGQDSEDDGRCFRRDRENNNVHPYQDVTVMKKERRRERNKVSAQNYRQRRRQQSSAAHKSLESLQVHNKNLLDQVRQLEAEKHIVEEYLKSCVRVPWCPFHRASPSPHHHCTPTIPEHEPIQPIVQPISPPYPGDTTLGASCPPPEQPCCNGASNFPQLDNCRPMNMTVDNECRPVAMAPDNANNNTNTNMPQCMPGGAPSSGDSSTP